MRFERDSLSQWCIWFFLGQIILFWLVGLFYLPTMPTLELNDKTTFFVLLSYLAHLGVLAAFPLLFFVPFALILPWRRLIIIAAVTVATMNASLLLSDTLVYNRYQFHMNGTVLALAFHGITKGVLGLSYFEKFMPFIITSVFLAIEWLYSRWLWRHSQRDHFFIVWVKWLASLCLLASCLMMAIIYFSMNHFTARTLIEKTRFLPLYVEVLGSLIPKSEENFALLRIDEKNPLQWIASNKTLDYPKQPLKLTLAETPLNLLIVVIDTWRYDMLNEEVTPHLFAFSKKAWVFNQHFSGGNSTLPGVFSLLYGLPATYLPAMEAQHRGPLLLDTLIQQNYQMGVFSSAPLYTPPMNKSIFQSIKNLQVGQQPAETVFARDQLVTNHFEQFIKTRNKAQPFFSFLFFDAAHSYCGSDDIPGPFQPTANRCNRLSFNRKSDFDSYFNRYKNAIFSIDQQIDAVLHTLEAQHLLENTVVMIVGDHGEEFDDAGRGFYGHGSNFSRYQVQTPLVLYWPNEKPQQMAYQTSHFDIVPTLMTKLFGCQNQVGDYSVGRGLLDLERHRSPYFVISSYVNFGVVEPEKITTIYPDGDYQIEKLNGETRRQQGVNIAVMRQVFNELQWFYQG